MYTGHCLCGLVKYRVEGDIKVVVNCHCQYCRLAHGAEFVAVAMLPAEKLRLLAGEEFLSRYEVAEVAAFRCFCSKCGTRLFNHSPSFNFISLMTTTLSGSVRLEPLANVNMESRNLSFEQSNGLPNFDKVPSTEELLKLK
jgi:hypothetical protein